MKDLTKGKPSTLILAFALPIFLGNLLQLTYSVTDTRIVGSFLGEDALAAVGATTTLSNLIIGFLLGLANGFAIITAQRFGAKDIRGVKKSFAASLVLGTVISVVLTVLDHCIVPCIFTADPAVFKCAGASDSGGRTLHIYHHSGTSCDIPL